MSRPSSSAPHRPDENSPGPRLPLQNRQFNMPSGQPPSSGSAVVIPPRSSLHQSSHGPPGSPLNRSQALSPPSSYGHPIAAILKRKPTPSDAPDSATSQQPVFKRAKQDTMSPYLVNILEPLLSNLEGALVSFEYCRSALWYPSIRVTHHSLCRIKSRDELLKNPYLNTPFDIPNDHTVPRLIMTFNILEDCRIQALANIKALPSPSQFAIAFPYFQRDPSLALRTGRTLNPGPFPLELLHPSFYNYTITQFNIRPFQSGMAQDKDIAVAWQCAGELLRSMPKFFTSHDHRLVKFSSALTILFPNDSIFEWIPNSPILPGAQERFDLVYMRISDKYPLIALELKLELGTGGDPFFQNARAYDIITTKKPHYRKFGFPMFFIQVAGTSLTFGGAFCDSDSGSPVFGHLSGGVILEPNTGTNHFGATASLWALKHTFKSYIQNFPTLSDNFDPHPPPSSYIPNAPRIISNSIRVTSVLKPGVLYTIETELPNQSPEQHGQPQTYCMKAIYPIKHAIAPSQQTYGLAVHKYLAQDGRAPGFYFAEAPNANVPNRLKASLPSIKPLVEFYIMDYLTPPSDLESGWITLHEFGSTYIQVAKNAWEKVNNALNDMITYLRKEGWVHGDLRANNVMIRIKLLKDEHDSDSNSNQPPSCIVEYRPGSKLVHLKLVDCDWSGKAGQVHYPVDRNPHLFWPGEAGGPISQTDDEEMVSHWMKNWPVTNFIPTLSEAGHRWY